MKIRFNNKYEELFFKALRIRMVEQHIADIYPSDKIQSPIHLSIGQEHISVGICEQLEKDDFVFGTYRGHALYLAKGGDLRKMMAELFGKMDGCGKGRAGSMHLSSKNVGMMGSAAIVAGTIPHAVGSALAQKIKKTKNISVVFFGEGATGEGVYHESLNFAANKRLPVLFVCENNDLAIYSKVSWLHSFSIDEHARLYDIHTIKIGDGLDLERIALEAKNAVSFVREGNGPSLIEIKTYRYKQHVGPYDDNDIGYRDIEELKEVLKRDPLVTNCVLIDKFSPIIEAEIMDAVEFAERSPYPDETELYKYVM